MYLLY